ncbi:uncharacterized protein EKO05_0002541 [Ascochyta rabiei]|uniref:uncharacterized protein n=1 Tax=Didymella rabiei TaxID=5454 RepID=UPI0022100193|nr:uncharacterized protein EKO05_0002541 [Ascochyta rabiei]UPX11960.1 hypothetical protein EKO05_0002541 [Ascochyta rabiei]
MRSRILPAPSPTPITSPNHSLSHRRPRVSAEHALSRVRENQRRHRTRQKDHVVSLELKLAETERQLTAARAEIVALRQERDTANAFACYDISEHFNLREEQVDSGMAKTPSVGSPLESLSPDAHVALPAPSTVASPTVFAASLPILLPPTPSLPGPPPCCTDNLPTSLPTPSSDSIAPLDPECCTCKTRPPPSPSESTTLCAQAFVMISQQNFRNLDPDMIRLWLSQGYRRAVSWNTSGELEMLRGRADRMR